MGHAFKDISHVSNLENPCKPTLYLNSVIKSDFHIAFEIDMICFNYILQFSISLQNKQKKLSKTLHEIMMICALEELR